MLRSPRALAALVLTATLLFALGSFAERDGHHEESASSTSAVVPNQEAGELGGGEAHDESSEAAEQAIGAGHAEGPDHADDSHERGQEATFLGLNRESAWLDLAAVLISLGLAVALFASPGPAKLWAALVWGLAFAAADAAELLERPAAAVAAIAVVLLALHLAAAALAAELMRTKQAVS